MNRTSQIRAEITSLSEILLSIKEENKFDFYEKFQNKVNFINELSLAHPEQRQYLMKYCYDLCGDLDQSIMHHAARHKPMGYPGDYLIIDWIYTEKLASQGIGKDYDEIFHWYGASQAVRNRKKFFSETVKQEIRPDMSILNLACGPCRDLYEVLKLAHVGEKNLFVHCVDMDKNAIAYATELLRDVDHLAYFQWEVANVFRITPSRQYDLVWSAGLFDYLDKRWATALIMSMWRWCKPGGKVIFGNFHPRNSTRNIMEWLGSWFLIHRTEDELMSLCEGAGIPKECISFDHEPLGINLFCILTKE